MTKSSVPRYATAVRMRLLLPTTILAFTLFLSGCLFVPKTPVKPVPSNTAATSTSATIDTSDWKTYTNDEYGFSFRYPRDYLASSTNAFSSHFEKLENRKAFAIEYLTPESWKSFIASDEYAGGFPENRWIEESNFYNSFVNDPSSFGHYKLFVTPQRIRFIKSGGYYPPGGNYVIRYHTVVGKLGFALYSYSFDYKHEALPSGNVTKENDLRLIENAILNKQMFDETNNQWLKTIEFIISSFDF